MFRRFTSIAAPLALTTSLAMSSGAAPQPPENFRTTAAVLHAPPGTSRGTSAEIDGYRAREAKAPEARNFRGGSVIIISASALALILVIVLLIVLL